MKRIADWLIYAVALVLVSRIVPGIRMQNFGTALLAVVIMSTVNILIKPLLTILTLPITLVTFGLFTFVINAFMFLIAARLTPGFYVDSFMAAFIGSIVLTIISAFFQSILHGK